MSTLKTTFVLMFKHYCLTVINWCYTLYNQRFSSNPKKLLTMKKPFLFLATLFLSFGALQAQSSWSIDPVHSKVQFTVSHLVISEVSGDFKIYEGQLKSKNDKFENSQISFTADVVSVNTDNTDRDEHLRSEDFFYVEKYPKMTFKSKSFKKVNDNNYKLTGDLTLRGVTKTVSFDVSHGGTVVDPYGNTKAGFKVTGLINRKDYGLQWSTLTEAGGAVVGDEIQLTGNIQLQKQAAVN